MAVPTSTPPTEEERIPRPENMFFLFRKSRQAQLAELGSEVDPALPAQQQSISKRLSVEWKLLPAQERQEWKRKAEEEKRKHKELHPNYKYKPKNKEQKQADKVLREEEAQKKQAAAAAAGEKKKRSRASATKGGRARKSKTLAVTASASSYSIASSWSTATAPSSSSTGAALLTHATAPSSLFDGAPSMFAAGPSPLTVSSSTAPSSELATPSPVDPRAIDFATSDRGIPYVWQAPALLDGAAFPTAVLGTVYDAHNTRAVYDRQNTYGAQNTMSLHTMNGTETKDPGLVYVQNYGYMDPATAAMYADITENRYNDRVDYNGQGAYAASGSFNGTSSDDSIVAGMQNSASGNESFPVPAGNLDNAIQSWDHYLTPENIASFGYDTSSRYPASLSRTASDMSSASMSSSAPQTTDYRYSSSTSYDHSSSTTFASRSSGNFDFASDAANGGDHASTDFDYSSASQSFDARDTDNDSSFGGMPLSSDFDAVAGTEGAIDYSGMFVNPYAPSTL
ncbi:hypothetical protein BD626DRAFT_536810 [Schizophyllum amplum]|uniref:HMG box domain-containing protein n=1 Tax=Schizophyllum amplum TaxID=97359 RepID=A0A550CF01_9AGAR|nr:hypothetical protein BD626DRAFT_536810 [Auriculariopsis ampla]